MFEIATVVLIILLVILPLLYFSWTANFGYWRKRGVPHPPYSLLFGNVADVFLMKRSLGAIIQDVYDSFEDLNYVGFYKVRQPAVLIRDVKLAKTILIKEFSSFHDNDIRLHEDADPLGRNPFIARGEKWRFRKQELKTYFTPKKQKLTIPAMNESSKTLIEYINNLNGTNKQEEVKSSIMRYTIQNVSAAGFGISAGDSLINLIYSSFTDPLGGLKEALIFMLPDVAYFLRFRLIPKKLTDFFDKMYGDLLKDRISKGIICEDYMNVLVELYKKSLFTKTDVVAQSIALFIDGTETTSQSIITALYELALNPEKQEKLKEEVDEKLTGELTYELLQDMKYLDCVVNGTSKSLLQTHVSSPKVTSSTEYRDKMYGDLLKDRISKGIICEDYMNVLVELYKKSLFTKTDVVAQSIALFIDGTETTSQGIITALYELALNPEKQEKLKEEVDEKLTGELTYELLQDMKYLDCVVNGTSKSLLQTHVSSPKVTSSTEYRDKMYGDLLKDRISKGIICEDYMNVLVELYKKSLFTKTDVVAQSIALFIDGTETTSQGIITALYELALNPEKQEKLKEEVDEKLTGELTYELLQDMKYLDCVVNEAQRLHPPVPVLTKICTKAYKLPPINKDGTGKEITLDTGNRVLIPVRAFHLDPNIYPDPEKFYPERFLEGSKDYPLLTFGDGPRICLGMRFALLQMKVCLVHLVKNFKIKLNSKTIVPLQYNPTPFIESIKGGIWLDFERRSIENINEP